MTKKNRLAKNKKAGKVFSNLQQAGPLFDQGFAHYQAGRRKEAEDCCRAVLAIDRHHPDALHLLGMTCQQTGDDLKAIGFIKKAISIDPDKFFYHLNLGNIYFSQKNHAAAEICYQKALDLNPNFTPTIIHLAKNLAQSQRLPEAIDYYKKALTIEPNTPAALTGLGNTLLAAGMIEESIATLRKLVKIAPNSAEAHYNLGGALRDFGDLDAATGQYKKALQLCPDFVEAYYNLGQTLEASLGPSQPLPERISFYKRALASEPNQAIALTGLGDALLATGMIEESITILRKLVKTAPDSAESYSGLGVVLMRSGDIEGAAKQYKKSLQLRPDLATAYPYLGLTYEYFGRTDKAVALYRQAIKIQPSFSMAHCLLAQIQKHSTKDDDIVAMENIYNSESLNNKDRMLLAFGLAKAYEDIRSYDRAFDFLAEANNMKRATYKGNIAYEEAYFEQIKKVFDRPLFNRLTNAGTAQEGAIFVLGMPRSGTSLVEQILASHPGVYGAGELPTLENVLASNHMTPASHRDFENRIKAISAPTLEEMGRKYLTITKSLNKGEETKYIVNKMPHNFLHIGMIKLMLPNAKVVLCNRHPMDNCLSIYKNLFHIGHEYAYNQTELGEYYQLYQKLMEHWNRVLPGFIYDIHYEDLVADQEKQSRALFEFCGIPWDSKSLTFYETDRTVTTLSSSQVRRPIYKDSVKLWEKYGDRLKELADALRQNI